MRSHSPCNRPDHNDARGNATTRVLETIFPLSAMPAELSAVPETDTDTITDATEADVTFASLGVPAPLVESLAEDGIVRPFPVQAATLPDALAGRDILGRAQTGSGKTLGFSLPMVTRLAGGETASGRPRGLVLVPTRELATQVQEVLRPLARSMGLWVTTIYGGVSYGPQVTALRRRTDIVVATPGRLADLINQGECDLSDVEIMVIDEADQMADLGFLPIVRRLLEATPASGQRMLFSATLDAAIDVLVRRFLDNPATHSVNENSSPAEIEHHVFTIDPAKKLEVLAALAGGDKRSLVFTRTKHGAERLARQLTELGIPAAELHGNLRQGARARNLAAFSSGVARVMVATDIAARGIHVDGIDLVIHADPPTEHKAYVHRSGRTARGGADGIVVTLQLRSQAREVTAMMHKAGITPHTAVITALEADELRAIGGPPADRVSVSGKVSELVRPEDRLAGNGAPGRAGYGRGAAGHGGSRDDRPRRDRQPGGRYGDRAGSRDRRDFAPRGRDERPAAAGRADGERGFDGPSGADARTATFARDERPARFDADRRFGQDRDDRSSRYQRDSRPADGGRTWADRTADDRPARFDRDARFNRDDRPARFNRDDRPTRFGQGDRPARFGRDGQFDRGQRFEGNRDDRSPGDRPANGPGQPDGGRRFDRDRDERSWGGSRGPRGNSFRDDRPAHDDRPYGQDRDFSDRQGSAPAGRDGRSFGGDRPGSQDRPPLRGNRDYRDSSGGHTRPERGDWYPRENRPSRGGRPAADRRPGAAGGWQSGDSGGRAGSANRSSSGYVRDASGRSSRPQAGGRRGGARDRSGYSAGRSGGFQTRDQGQGRHF
jgi:superfamily II DNA/RNA helicase